MNELKSPLNVQIELTDLCNNKCNYCYNFWNYSNKNRSVLSLNEAENIKNQLLNQDVFSAILTGGEPFFNKEVLYYLVRELTKNGMDIAINSNLTNIKDDDVKFLKDNNVLGVLTSLASYDELEHDSITGNKGSFKLTLKGIEIINRYNIPLAVNMVVTKSNVNSVYKTGEYVWNSLGIKAFNATPMNACSAAGNEHIDLSLNKTDYLLTLDSLIRLERGYNMITDILEPIPHCLIFHEYKFEKFLRRGCCAGTSTLAIGADSGVRPCTHSDTPYGNLNKNSLNEIWSLMADWRNGKYIPKECEPCSINTLCKGGCRTEALAYTGNLNGLNPLFKEKLSLIKEKKADPELSGKTLKFKDKINYRQEDENIAIIYSPRDKYLELSLEELKYMSLLKAKYPIFKYETLIAEESNFSKDNSKLKKFVLDLYKSEFIYSHQSI